MFGFGEKRRKKRLAYEVIENIEASIAKLNKASFQSKPDIIYHYGEACHDVGYLYHSRFVGFRPHSILRHFTSFINDALLELSYKDSCQLQPLFLSISEQRNTAVAELCVEIERIKEAVK